MARSKGAVRNGEGQKRKREAEPSKGKQGSAGTQASKKAKVSKDDDAARMPPPPITTTSDSPPQSETTKSTAPSSIREELASTHELTTMSIISASHIQAKVTRILETLATFSFVAPAKPQIVVLHAKAGVASKMISIAEIAKREIAQNGGKWFQYNVLEQSMVERPGISRGGKEDGRNEKELGRMNLEDDEDEETTAFETMKTPFERAIEGKPKVRAVPIMTLCLSRVRVDALKRKYGEQTNALH